MENRIGERTHPCGARVFTMISSDNTGYLLREPMRPIQSAHVIVNPAVLQIRNGSGTSPVVFRECVSSTPVSLPPSRRWVWVRFKTDYRVSNTGFQAIWTTVESNTTGDTINILVHNLTVSGWLVLL